MEKTTAKKGELCDFEDSDEEYERMVKESHEARIAEFTPHVDFSSHAMSKLEAEILVQEGKIASIDSNDLTDPKDESSILLHNEASDSFRINKLIIHVVRAELKANELPMEEILNDLEL